MQYFAKSKQVMFVTNVCASENCYENTCIEFVKCKSFRTCLILLPDFKIFATWGADKKIWVFRFLMGKLYSVIDESLHHCTGVQQNKSMMLSMEFNWKFSNKKELEKSDSNYHCNIIYGSTWHLSCMLQWLALNWSSSTQTKWKWLSVNMKISASSILHCVKTMELLQTTRFWTSGGGMNENIHFYW